MYTTIDDVKKPVTLLLKGDSGSGKTWKAAQFPRPVFFNWDNNLSGLRKLPPELRKQVRVVDPRVDKDGKAVANIKIFDNFVSQLETIVEDKTIGTIVFDSLTTMAEALMDKVLKSDLPSARVEIQHWGEIWRYFKWLGEEVLCNQGLDKHVIWIAHEQLKEDKLSGKTKYLLSLGGQAKQNLDLFFSDVWRCYNRTGKDSKTEYWVRCLPNDYHTAKSSLVLPPDFNWDVEAPNVLKQVNEGLPAI
jgi:hypothetical protein